MSQSKVSPKSKKASICSVPDGEATPIVKGSHVYLVDGSGYIFRAFHALPPLTRPSDGTPVGAVHGFCAMLWKLLQDSRKSSGPTHLAVMNLVAGRSIGPHKCACLRSWDIPARSDSSTSPDRRQKSPWR